jgi:hypothetical protein
MRASAFAQTRYHRANDISKNRSLTWKIARLVAGIRYIAIPTIAEAMFSYRRAG